MFNKSHINLVLLILVISAVTTFSFNKVNAHEDKKAFHKKHKPIVCILEQDRSYLQRRICKDAATRHRLCKYDEYCAVLKLKHKKK